MSDADVSLPPHGRSLIYAYAASGTAASPRFQPGTTITITSCRHLITWQSSKNISTTCASFPWAIAHILTPAIRQYAGDSRGRWDGDSLIVETTNFNDRAFIRRFNGVLSKALHVVERFTRVSPDRLDYQFTVNDPKTWTKPWTGTLSYRRIQGPLFEYACHEGNYGLTNILAGSRTQDPERAATDR